MVGKRREGKVRAAALHRASEAFMGAAPQGSAASSHSLTQRRLLQPPRGPPQPQPVLLQQRPASAWVSPCVGAEHLHKCSRTLENTALIKGKTCEKDVLQEQQERQ